MKNCMLTATCTRTRKVLQAEAAYSDGNTKLQNAERVVTSFYRDFLEPSFHRALTCTMAIMLRQREI